MKTKLWSGILIVGLLVAFGRLAVSMGEEGEGGGLAPVSNATYAKECGACHFAYPPGLLPSASWKKIMGNLSDHFGDNAELAPKDQAEIASYLDANGADRAAHRQSAKALRSLGGKEPIRITEVPYIRRKHDEIPARLIAGNPKVKKLSNCAACHTTADRGIFSEGNVVVPGYGRWDD